MHSNAVGLAICFLLGYELTAVISSKSYSSLHQSRLIRHARDIRTNRKARELEEPGSNEKKCNYTVALLDFPPYVMNKTKISERGFMYDRIVWFISTACFETGPEEQSPCNLQATFVKNTDKLVDLVKSNKVDFAFPIFSEAKEALDGIENVTIIRAFASQGCSLIVNTKQCEAESRTQLLTSITSQWPILACIILLSGISGVVIWLLEHRTNKTFSTAFTEGSPEGFWWAVVSLTTVGYGDKTPKTFPGRLFGVVWILVGAIMLSLFTALFTNAMQAALDGTKCQDIASNEVGVSIKETETQVVAKEFEANIVKFDNLEQMQRNLSSGDIGRVLVDRNTAFHFLDKSGLKRNRQIRLIRNIDYPMDYFLAFTKRDSSPPEIAGCGPTLKELTDDLVAVAKSTAQERLIPAQLQTASLSNEMEGLFSTGSQMTTFILFCLLGIFGALVCLGILWEVYTRCNVMVTKRKGNSPDKGNLINLHNKTMSMMQNFIEMEERLQDLTTELRKIKEEYASTITHQRHKRSDDEDNADENQSLFNFFKNGKSKNTETIL